MMALYDYFANRKKNPMGSWVRRKQAEKLAGLAERHVQKPGTILEIGPGDGYFAERCLQAGYTYTGVDANSALIRTLREKGVRARSAVVPPIPLEDRSMDACCLFHVLEHMAHRIEAEELLDEINRVLIEGGRLFVACPNHYSWGRDFFNIDYSHNFVTTPRRVRQLISDRGFRMRETHFYAGHVFGPLRYLILALNRMLYWKTLNRVVRSDVYYKGFVTFLESFVMIAQKDDSTGSSQ